MAPNNCSLEVMIDPHNRESLWPIHNTNSDLYKFISTLAKFRTKIGATLYAGEHVERYVDDQIYAFTRGKKGEVNTLYCVYLLIPLLEH